LDRRVPRRRPHDARPRIDEDVAMSTVTEADIALRDGSTVHVRPVRSSDVDALAGFLGGLSEEARTFRFFSAGADVHRAARRFADPSIGGGLVAVTREDGRVVGHGQYVRESDGTAEVAFAIADAWQGQGIATLLLAGLAQMAAGEGIETFTAVVMPDNRKMIDTFRASGFPVEVRSRPGELHLTFPTTLTDDGRRRFEERERIAAVAAVSHVLRPRSVAVVGASRRPGSIGATITRNLACGGFTGSLYAINPAAGTIEGVPAYPSIGAVPEAPELAVLAVPADRVVAVARECGAAGVRALVVVSSGFAEVGAEGHERQRELLAVCRAAGMRMVGPNCLGVITTAPAVGLNASFAPAAPSHGRLGFASQSGAFGIASVDLARTRGIGLSSFVSLGDKADLSGNDFLQFWEDDPDTDVIALYLESFGNPRKFGRLARRITPTKPVIVVKSGRSQAGRRAVSSHTGALLAAADTSVDALFRHAGVIRTETIGELFDVATLLSRQPLPAGDRVAVVTNAGGPGILCTDACEAAGLRVEPLAAATQQALAALLPSEASVANPVDLIASASATDYARALEHVLGDPGVDAVIAIFVRPLTTRAADVDAAIRGAAGGKPVLAVFLGPDVPPAGTEGVPGFASVEEAARALVHAVRYARHHADPPDPQPRPDGVDADSAAAVVAEGLADGGGWLPPRAAEALLAAYGVPLGASHWATTPHGVRRAAERLGGRVAVKAAGAGLLHKTEAGAVRLDLSPSAAGRVARDMRDALCDAGTPPDGFLVQRMAPPGPELLVGVVGDPRFGPLVAVGAGGAMAELLGDVEVRLAPVGPRVAGEMLRELRTYPLLEGYRGSTPVDVAAVEDVVVRVSALAAAHPEIAELDCNPVIAGPAGAVVVDARVRLQPPPATPLPGALDR
jgi:acetyl coenzyme A synthetase (ADP forming)-like protein